MDYRTFYHLECHLELTVKARFHQDGELGAFDFFCIVIWKANRAKSRVAERLLSTGLGSLDESARALTRAVAAAPTSRLKLELLIREWKILLPMASAILSVLYPEDFTRQLQNISTRSRVRPADHGVFRPHRRAD